MTDPAPARGLLTTLAARPLLLDAGMGTRLIARGLAIPDDDPAAWNLERPGDVLDVHRLDVGAGADAVVTNTFGANRPWLVRYGLDDRLVAINRAAVGLARQAAGPGRFVFGSIGPAAAVRPDAYREQAALLAEAGVDALWIETHSFDEAHDIALPALAGRVALPLLVALRDADRLSGDAARRLVDLGASAVGGNCLPGMEPLLRMAKCWCRAVDVPLIAKPAAGLPGAEPAGPGSFAAAVPDLLARGVRLIGGCCGTTEAHVAALRDAFATAGR